MEAVFEKLDGRTKVSRKQKDMTERLLDLVCGDRDPDFVEEQRIKRAVILTLYCEEQEAKYSQGEEMDSDNYLKAISYLEQIYRQLGLARVAGGPRGRNPGGF